MVRQNLAQVTKKVVDDLEELKWNARSAWSINGWAPVYLRYYITIAEHYIFIASTWFERSGYGDHIAVHLHFEQIKWILIEVTSVASLFFLIRISENMV